MFNKKNIFFGFILIIFIVSFSHFILESKTKNELNIYSGRKSHLIEPLIKEFGKNKKIKVNLITGKSDEFIEKLNNEFYYKDIYPDELNPYTGRKHQLRKQLLIHNHPVIGDMKYNLYNKSFRQNSYLMLHAYKIGFSVNDLIHEYRAELPIVFKKTLKEKYLKNF